MNIKSFLFLSYLTRKENKKMYLKNILLLGLTKKRYDNHQIGCNNERTRIKLVFLLLI